MGKKQGSGWHGEPWRHSLARRNIKTVELTPQDLRKIHPRRLMPKISKQHNDTLWYASKNGSRLLAYFEDGDRELVLVTMGDISLYVQDLKGREHQITSKNIADLAKFGIFDDQDLQVAEDDGILRWDNNNWVQPMLRFKGEDEWHDLNIGTAYTYDDAITLGKELLVNDNVWNKYRKGELNG